MPQTTNDNPVIDLGVLSAEPAEEYHAKAGEFLSSHHLLDFMACPWLYRKKQLGLIVDTDSPALPTSASLKAATPTRRNSPSVARSIPARVSPSDRTPRPLPSGPNLRASRFSRMSRSS